jgi:hypothetical protein
MPDLLHRIPRFGELWVIGLQHVEGIVCEVSEAKSAQGYPRVTFVSLTGNRAALTVTPSFACTLKRVSIQHTSTCDRFGCTCAAVVAYKRDPRLPDEFVCPKHIPRGVQSRLLDDLNLNIAAARDTYMIGRLTVWQNCVKCGNDAIEVLGEVPRGLPATMWNCGVCGEWWCHLNPASETKTIERIVSDLTSVLCSRYTIYEVSESSRLRLKPMLGTHLRGIKPLTVYDHIIEDEW